MRIKAPILILALCLSSITCSDDEKPVQYDRTAPEVLSTELANGVTDVHENDSIVVTFSECINSASVTSQSFLVNGGDVTGNAYGSNDQAVFVPTESLQHDSTYTVTLTTSIKDCSGNPIEENFEWTFTIRERPKTVIYFCSFESLEEADDWPWFGEDNLADDAAPGCGYRSAQFRGGCVQPAFWFWLNPANSGYYVMSCWGKQEAWGASITLSTERSGWPDGSGPKIRIEGNEWISYKTSDSLYCSAEDSLVVEVWHGGFVSRPPVLIDCFKIERLDR